MAVHALIAAGMKQCRIAILLTISQKTVSNDAETSVVTNLTDERVVEGARSLIALTAGRGSTETERRLAQDWLLEQTNPSALHTARHLRALNHAIEWTSSAKRQLEGIDTKALAGAATSSDDAVRQKTAALLAESRAIATLISDIERRIE